MPPETSDRRPARMQHDGSHPPEPEQLPCPRCESTNTKFCYYNNYNLSQPRHFCKSCRRYWTRGGTLRNVPVGGGTRNKNPNKRSRTAAATSSSSSSSLPDPEPSNPIAMIPGIKTHNTALPLYADVDLNANVPEAESYASFMNPHGGGLFALSGFGVGSGFGFGVGAGMWHMEDVSGGNGGGGVGVPGTDPGCNTWQVGSGEGGLADVDCFGWPDLAISTPGKGLK